MSFVFGKYKGKSVAEVASIDLNYLKWIAQTHSSWQKPPSPAFIEAVNNAVGTGTGTGSVTTEKPTLVLNASTSAEPIINFGKYRGQPLSVLLADKPYATWCCQQDFFKRNALYGKVITALELPSTDDVVTTIYSSGSSGIRVLGDGDTVTFGKYKDQSLAKMLADVEYCKWVADKQWERKPRHFDKIAEAVKNAKPVVRTEEHWEPSDEDEYELDDQPLEMDDEQEPDDTPLDDPED